MSQQNHIFISYSREDRRLMERVRDVLAGQGLNAWTDEGIEEGTPNWQLAIEKAIEEAECLVCVLTPAAKRSSWVREELVYATLQEKPIYMLHALGDYKQVAILGFTVAQLVDLRDAATFDSRLEQLGRRIHATASDRSGPNATCLFARDANKASATVHGADEPRSQTEEIVSRFIPLTIPPGERHTFVVLKCADHSAKPSYRLDRILVTLGRDQVCPIRIVDDSVSREHCQLIFTTGGLLLRDLGSTNGTYVNEAPVRLRTLKHGDLLRVGLHCTLRYELEQEPEGSAGCATSRAATPAPTPGNSQA